MPWIGPYSIYEIINNNLCVLKNGEKVLKTKHLLKNIKHYYERHETNNYAETSMDVDCVQTFRIKQGISTQLENWQQAKCRVLKIYFQQNLEETDLKIKILNYPCAIQNIISDGNCLFRAFSYAVIGIEEHHLIIRQNITTVI